jgi:hypothetical protein
MYDDGANVSSKKQTRATMNGSDDTKQDVITCYFQGSGSLAGSTSSWLTQCGRVTQICVFNTVKLGTSASSP